MPAIKIKNKETGKWEELPTVRGKSAYEIWLEQGNTGTEQDFLDSLNGTDGFSPTTTVTQTETGATITVTDKNGTTTTTITNGKDGYTPIKDVDYFDGNNGKDGKDGYTPVKGVDYFTDKDKQEIAGLVDVNTVPNYIKEEAKRVVNNIQAVRTAKTLVFPAMSDFHNYDGNSSHDKSLLSTQYAGMGINEINKMIHMDFVALLGDYSYMDGSNYTVEQVKKDIIATKEALGLKDNEIWCIGNHDLCYGKGCDRLTTQDELYAYITANSKGNRPYANIERGYGYLDFEEQKIRVIFLNTCDVSDWKRVEGENAQAEWISPTQIQWLADTALNFSDKDNVSEWGIVLIGHHPLHYAYKCFGSAMTILEAYRDGLSGTLACTVCTEIAEDGTKTYPSQNVTYDFSNTERAEIICNVHGHNHNCGSSKISSTSWAPSLEQKTPWLWRFCASNICANRYNEAATSASQTFKDNFGEFDENGNPVYWEKEQGTAKATSFCVVSIDRKNKKIYSHIFGAGKDRMFSYDEEYVLQEYSINVTTENCSGATDNATTIREDENVTMTFTANEGYELPTEISVSGANYVWDETTGVLTLSIPTNDVVVSITATEIEEEEPTVTYTNQLPISTDTDGSVYNGKGFKENTYLSSSSEGTRNDVVTTGYIPVGTGSSATALGEQVVRFANTGIKAEGNTRINLYTADKTYVYQILATKFGEGLCFSGVNIPYETDGNDYITSVDLTQITYNRAFVASAGEIKFIRICGAGINENSIITVNEVITQ